MSLNKIKAWYRLLEKKNVGLSSAHRIVGLLGDPTEYIGKNSDFWNEVDFLDSETKYEFQQNIDPPSWNKIANFIENTPNFQFITYLDEDYPDSLKNIYQPPLFITAHGDVSLLKNEEIVSIVGTRRPTQYGKYLTEKIVCSLVRNNFIVCSGLALGIDSVAHRKTIEFSGQTIAVLAGGLENIYPPQNLELANKIKASGLVISENMPCTPLEKYHFPQRNRIIAGLSKAICVIEGNVQSGALITAKYGLDNNKEIYALPGDVLKPEAHGPNTLISRGAKIILTPDDIAQDLSIKYETKPIVKKVELTDDEKRILEIIKKNQPDVHIDILVAITGMNIGELSGILFMLELKNVVRVSESNKYSCAY